MAPAENVYKMMWEAARLHELFAMSFERNYRQDAFDILAWACERGVAADLAPPHSRYAPLSYSMEGVIGFHSALECALHGGDAVLIEQLAQAGVPAVNFGGRNLSQQLSPQLIEALFTIPVEMLPSDEAFCTFLRHYVFEPSKISEDGNMRAAFSKWSHSQQREHARMILFPDGAGVSMTRSYGDNILRGRLDCAHRNLGVSTTYSKLRKLAVDSQGRAEPPSDGKTIISFAELSSFDVLLAQGMMKSAKYILENGALIPSPKNFAVMIAAGRHEEIFELMDAYLAKYPDRVADIESSLLEAICSPLIERITADAMDEEFLHGLRLRVLDMALARGVDINTPVYVRGRDVSHLGVVHLARTGRVVRALLERGADVEMLDSKGDTPLLRLLRDWRDDKYLEELESLRLLLDSGASVSVRDERGRTVAQVAAPRGGEVKTLLRSAKLQQEVGGALRGAASQDVQDGVHAPRRRGLSL